MVTRFSSRQMRRPFRGGAREAVRQWGRLPRRVAHRRGTVAGLQGQPVERVAEVNMEVQREHHPARAAVVKVGVVGAVRQRERPLGQEGGRAVAEPEGLVVAEHVAL